MIRRRAVLAGIAGTLASRPLAAQPRDGMRRLSVLMANRASDSVVKAYVAALTKGLHALDWREGGNLRIDWRWTGGDPALFDRDAAELLALGPDVLLAQGSPSVVALRRQTSTIPIVFTMVSDPEGQGFVESLAHPGGNVTGFSDFNPLMAGKWLEILTQMTPPVAQVAVLYNPATAPYAGEMIAEIEAMAAELAHEGRGGLLVLTDLFNIVHRDVILRAAALHRLPAIYFARSFALAGGLISYGIDYPELFLHAAVYIDRVLKGTSPRDLPVQQPNKFELVINLKTAKARDITIATALLATADEVIE